MRALPAIALLLGLAAAMPAEARGHAKKKAKGPVAPAAAVHALVSRERPAIERCYELNLKRHASSGEVLIALTLDRSGAIRDAQLVRASKKQASVGRCIAGHLRAARLPRLTESAKVEVPIRLTPARG